MIRSKHEQRRGVVLPLLTICLVGLMAFVALAIDIGVLAVARNQAQNAADAAALAGARTLDGKSTNNNLANAITQAQTTATSNAILNTNITLAQVTTAQGGIYRYDTTAQRFQAVFNQAPSANEAYGVIQVSLTTQQPTFFAKVMGVSSLTVGATATAVHRPRDISIVLDFSGSMGYSSRAHNSSNHTSMNPDSRYPRFGPWSVYSDAAMIMDINNPGTAPGNLNTYTPPTPLQRVWAYVDSSGYLYAPNNHTIDMPGGPAIVGQFVQSDNSTQAFVSTFGTFPTFTNVNVSVASNPTSIVTPAPDTFSNQSATGFVGDQFPLRFGQSVSGTTAPTPDQYAHTVWRLLYSTASGASNATICPDWEANGYDATYSSVSAPNASGIITATVTPKAAANKYQGFTMGPGYWGKTFYMWPPDPRTPVGQIGAGGYVAGDWRQRFFLPVTGSIPVDDTRDSAIFWAATGRWVQQAPGAAAAYMVNYDNILAWMARGPQTLPSSLRCGRVVYYDTMPTTIPVDQSTGLCTAAATNDQRFWKDYIDYIIGSGRWTDSNSLYGANSANSNTGGGATLYYNQSAAALTPQITARASLGSTPVAITGATKATPIVITSNGHGLKTGWTTTISGVLGNTAANGTWTVTVTGANTFSLNGSTGNANYTGGGVWRIIPNVQYGDSPVHPRMQFWFGPQSLMAYLQEPGNWFPGNCYEAQCWQLKAGVSAAIDDIKNNHPNDLASVVFFSGSNGYNTARVSMGKSYTNMKNCLFYPFSLLNSLGTATSTIHPFATTTPSTSNPAGIYDTTDTEVPNAGTSTCPHMGFMVAFNEAGSASTFTGRKTASKVLIYETDGLPNTSCATGTLSGGYYSNITAGSNIGLSTSLHVAPKDNARSVVKQYVASTTASPPGYSTSRNPARVHAIAFGDLFESYSTSAYKGPALTFLAAVQIDGNTTPTPTGNWDVDALDPYAANGYLTLEPYKLIVGSYSTRIANMTQALQRIMQGGIQVALIQ